MMKKCKYCQQELGEDAKFCSKCGKPAAEEPEEMAASVNTADRIEPVETAVQPEKKKTSPGIIALMVAGVVMLAAILTACIVFGLNTKKSTQTEVEAVPSSEAPETVAATIPADGNPDDVTCKGSYTVTGEEAMAARETVVAAIGNHKLTNGELQTYYFSMVNSYLSSEYGYYLMMTGALDYTQPYDTQYCAEDDNLTWQQYFLQEALNYWQLSVALAEEAAKAGYTVSQEDQAYLENLPAQLEETAKSYDMTLEELMKNNIGSGGTLDDFLSFQKLYLAGKDFYQDQVKGMQPTQEQLEAFYAEHAEGYEQGGLNQEDTYVDVRHILVKPTGGTTDEDGNTTYSDAEWETCREKAQALLDQYLAGDRTEDSFAALANASSEDPGSNTNGGLYENVYEGQMVAPFEEWCFDESRVYGDTGLVQTSYGYHVMFYVENRPMWISFVESDWVTEQSNAMLAELKAGYPAEVFYSDIVLGSLA